MAEWGTDSSKTPVNSGFRARRFHPEPRVIPVPQRQPAPAPAISPGSLQGLDMSQSISAHMWVIPNAYSRVGASAAR